MFLIRTWFSTRRPKQISTESRCLAEPVSLLSLVLQASLRSYITAMEPGPFLNGNVSSQKPGQCPTKTGTWLFMASLFIRSLNWKTTWISTTRWMHFLKMRSIHTVNYNSIMKRKNYWYTPQHEWITEALCQVTDVRRKGLRILWCHSNQMSRQGITIDRKQIRNCSGLG